MPGLKKVLFSLIIVLMILPAFQAAFHLFQEKPLRGAFVKEKFPEITTAAWFNGSYQDKFNNVLESSIGFHNTLVRINNQLDFMLYHKANAEGVIVGNNENLYEYDYIRSVTGIDFMGRKYMEQKLGRFKFLQDHLKATKNIDLVLVLEPGKASFFPEDIPGSYIAKANDSTNHQLIKSITAQQGLNCLDLIPYFIDLKEDSPYPLFTKNGTHWSVYGTAIATDTMIGYIEELRNIRMGPLHWDSIEFSTIPRDTDNDVETAMNLLFSLPQEKYAYPVIEYDSVNQYDKPLVLAIGDSYYWNIFNLRVPKYLFGNEAFWYFNQEIYPDFYAQPKYVRDIDIHQEVEKNEVVMIFLTERNHFNIDWRFIDMLYEAYVPAEYIDPIYSKISRMILHGPWFNEVIDNSRMNNEELGDVIWREAKYQLFLDDKFDYMLRFGQEYLEDVIRDDEKWMIQIREKATINNVSVEEMITIDADYMFKMNYPDLREMYLGIYNNYELIGDEPLLMDSVRTTAQYYNIPDQVVRTAFARRLYRDQRLREIQSSIIADPKWAEHVQEKALAKQISFDEMLLLDAEWVYTEEVKKTRENLNL